MLWKGQGSKEKRDMVSIPTSPVGDRNEPEAVAGTSRALSYVNPLKRVPRLFLTHRWKKLRYREFKSLAQGLRAKSYGDGTRTQGMCSRWAPRQESESWLTAWRRSDVPVEPQAAWRGWGIWWEALSGEKPAGKVNRSQITEDRGQRTWTLCFRQGG